jgi:hypothetical protein
MTVAHIIFDPILFMNYIVPYFFDVVEQDIVSIGSLWLDAYSAIAEDGRMEGIGTTKFTEQACYLVVSSTWRIPHRMDYVLNSFFIFWLI